MITRGSLLPNGYVKNYPRLCTNFDPTQITPIFWGYKLTYTPYSWGTG